MNMMMLLVGIAALSLVIIMAAFQIEQWKRSRFYQQCFRRQNGVVVAGAGSSEEHWPTSMGHPGNNGNSRHAGPKNFTEAFSWSWTDQRGRFQTPGIGGTAIDRHRNIYVAGNSALMKFSPDGDYIWTFLPGVHCGAPGPGFVMKSPCLWGDAVLGQTETGSVFAVNQATGREIWSTQFIEPWLMALKQQYMLIYNGFLQVSEGVVIVAELLAVYGLNASDGTPLWNFMPDGAVWNFKADFPGDGTFVFQTYEGTAYRCRVLDGTVIWKAGGTRGTWTSGSIALGPNNIVYAVSTKFGESSKMQPKHFSLEYLFRGWGGKLTAYALEDGREIWSFHFKKPPNNAPAIGRLSPGAGYSVIQPVGQQNKGRETHYVYAIDAETGELQWVFEGPIQRGLLQASSDLTWMQQLQIRPRCVTNAWSAPTIDSTGTVYIANQEGPIFALRDVNSDWSVNGSAEVQTYITSSPFCGSAAPSIAPGLMAIASCETMHVFRYSD